MGFARKQFVHGDSLLFADAAAHFSADGVSGEMLRCVMQPTRQGATVSQSRGIFRQSHKHTLRNVFRQMPVMDHAHGSGINEVHVPAYQFSKGRLRPVFSVIPEKLLVGQSIHHMQYLPG